MANLVNFESSPILGTMLAVKKTSMVSFYLNFLLFSITVADEENMPREEPASFRYPLTISNDFVLDFIASI